MKLGIKTIEKLTQGALYFENRERYIYPYHYSKSQLEGFKREGFIDGWLERAHFHGGVFVRFITDATELCLTYKPSSFSSNQNTIDIYVDNNLHTSKHLDNSKKQALTCNFRHGFKEITIYLPFDCQLGLRSIEINGTYRSIKKRTKKLLIIGDSITQGYGANISSCAYVNALERKTNLDIVAQGIGGYRFEPCDINKIEGYEPDGVISALGTNYYESHHKESGEYDYENSTSKYFERLSKLYSDKQILCITPLWRDDNVDMERLLYCIEVIKREASKYENITIVDGFDLVPHCKSCFDDNLHPNEYGSELYAQNLAGVIKELGIFD